MNGNAQRCQLLLDLLGLVANLRPQQHAVNRVVNATIHATHAMGLDVGLDASRLGCRTHLGDQKRR